jgi:hypothetical protein
MGSNLRIPPNRRLLVGLSLIVVAIGAAAVAWSLTVGWIKLGAPASGGGSPTWGPLAVRDFDYGAAALFGGTIRITDTCVLLIGAGNEESILVWYEGRTRWQAGAQQIVVENRNGGDVIVRDGDQVTLSGGGDSEAEGGLPGDQWIEGIDWVARPHPSCLRGSRWFVNEVVTPR